MDAYDTSLTQTVLTSLSEAREQLAAAEVGTYALFGGGANASGYRATIDAYDTSFTRSIPTPLSMGRTLLAGTTIGELDFAIFGGGRTDAAQNTVDVYDKNLTRTIPTTLSASRSGLLAGPIGVYALFAGGWTGTIESSVVDVFKCE